LATLMLTAAVLTADHGWLSGVFVALTVLTLVGTVAHRLRWLHQLPPPLGAPRPPRDVRFGLEGHDGLTMRMASTERQGVVQRVVIPPEGRPDEIPRVLVNAYVVGATHITRALPGGSTYRDGGFAGQAPDGPYWSISGVTLPIGAFEMFFKVTIPKPGIYEAVLTLQSPEFYSRGDQPLPSRDHGTPACSAARTAAGNTHARALAASTPALLVLPQSGSGVTVALLRVRRAPRAASTRGGGGS
jgi:hypothetical protein